MLWLMPMTQAADSGATKLAPVLDGVGSKESNENLGR